ncbi:hypothetical protein A0J61_06651 [Choanephora cucurbitarum]|uniref:SAP domain-containing protein n=1 Tax=Choanephora cucurbitarum TaxID=101091 RepID=A0A1C7N8A8_9FUNG|nr:hypothetical protein A0J61_06651 [Choanephora cucurbitarum]
MKKTELIQLAKENKLPVSGTKNEIIIDLLTHQTAKIVGSTTPSSINVQPEQHQPEEDPVVNADWVNAFDMKVAQRRSSRKPFSPQTESNRESKPHPLNDAFKKTVLSPTFVSQAEERVEEEKAMDVKKELVDDELDGMDPLWVEAFALKVSSRDKRQKTQDTLSPMTSTELDPITITESAAIETKPMEAEPANVESSNTTPVETKPVHVDTNSMEQPTPTHSSHESSNPSNRQWTSAAIGSSMLIWYFGGEEGFSKLWNFFTSSS